MQGFPWQTDGLMVIRSFQFMVSAPLVVRFRDGRSHCIRSPAYMCAKEPAAGVFTLKSAAQESPGQVFVALGEPGSLKGIYPERVAAGRARCPGGKARRCPATLHQS